ncbi:MAG: gamma-glutamylcyclotransferase family protein [bacterium]|nr:gamma-glutamylcyclotransferase family protein [bacterium]
MKIYIFGYGSLMNPKSLLKTLPGERTTRWATLLGYQRKLNAPVNGYLYLNIVPRVGKRAEGKVIAITKEELGKLQKRELGYKCVDITERMEEKIEGAVYTFLAPDKSYPGMQIPRSYLATCLAGKSDAEKQLWLKETAIENEIVEDMFKPAYVNAVFD